MKGNKNKQSDTKQVWLNRLLSKIAKDELIEGVRDILEIKGLDKDKRIFKITVKVRDNKTDYIVHAIVQLTLAQAHTDGRWWKLIDLSWEEVKR
jgi:uncharacterized lipoprotein YmbA